jgi:predicted SnoaL-like aldol condensation-catalyzing enzyme
VTNKDFVLNAVNELFVKRDPTALDRYWDPSYLQHNPGAPDGTGLLAEIVRNLGPDFRYEPGLVAADGDLVMIHGRYTNWGPKPLVAVDIFRVGCGKIVEHWDVLQEEVPASETKSGRPMFSEEGV